MEKISGNCFLFAEKVVPLQLKIKLGNVMTFILSILLVVDAVRAWGSRVCGIGVRSILPPPHNSLVFNDLGANDIRGHEACFRPVEGQERAVCRV